jgi:hypothetical protein
VKGVSAFTSAGSVFFNASNHPSKRVDKPWWLTGLAFWKLPVTCRRLRRDRFRASWNEARWRTEFGVAAGALDALVEHPQCRYQPEGELIGFFATCLQSRFHWVVPALPMVCWHTYRRFPIRAAGPERYSKALTGSFRGWEEIPDDVILG